MRYYVGCKEAAREVFQSENTPTEASHGRRYLAVIGPFDTKQGAEFMAEHGQGNPHCQCVADAERLAEAEEIDDETKPLHGSGDGEYPHQNQALLNLAARSSTSCSTSSSMASGRPTATENSHPSPWPHLPKLSHS